MGGEKKKGGPGEEVSYVCVGKLGIQLTCSTSLHAVVLVATQGLSHALFPAQDHQPDLADEMSI